MLCCTVCLLDVLTSKIPYVPECPAYLQPGDHGLGISIPSLAQVAGHTEAAAVLARVVHYSLQYSLHYLGRVGRAPPEVLGD